VLKQEAASQSSEPESQKDVQSTVVSGGSAPKKKIVEADDEDDSAAILAPPEIKPAAKAKSKPPAPSASKNHRTSASEVDVHEAQPNASGDRSLIRALGLKFGKIVIDPGHGGHDTGTIGPHRLLEKELVLEVSRRLG
jgi:N-acetylmuramoyl-L-alanine amidase